MTGMDILKTFESQQGLSYEMLQSLVLILHKNVESEIAALMFEGVASKAFSSIYACQMTIINAFFGFMKC